MWSDDGNEITFESLAAAYGLADDEHAQPAAQPAHLPFTAPPAAINRRIQPLESFVTRKTAPIDYLDDRASSFQLAPVQTTRDRSHAEELIGAASSPAPAFLTVRPGRDPNSIAPYSTAAASREETPLTGRAKPVSRRSKPVPTFGLMHRKAESPPSFIWTEKTHKPGTQASDWYQAAARQLSSCTIPGPLQFWLVQCDPVRMLSRCAQTGPDCMRFHMPRYLTLGLRCTHRLSKPMRTSRSVLRPGAERPSSLSWPSSGC